MTARQLKKFLKNDRFTLLIDDDTENTADGKVIEEVVRVSAYKKMFLNLILKK